ncbi:hypothetical protein, partial [Emticicia sp. W12TSBA100-4]|uniref:hypothetical protein n=1 Tax=Emticicia sp. W12TSBA100-4 TaxID=3160965 RepID=UPI003305DFF4
SVSIPYTTCDNGTPQACAMATLNINVTPASAVLNPDFAVVQPNAQTTGNVSTNDKNVPAGTTYGTPVPVQGNP